MAVGGLVLTRSSHRTCVGCRQIDTPDALVRVAGGPRHGGRGAWVHQRTDCAQAAARGGLARSLRRQITDAERAALAQIPGLSTPRPNQKAAGHDRGKAVEPVARIQAKKE